MKNILIAFIVVCSLLMNACKKQPITNPQPLLASVNVVDAVSDLGPFYVNHYGSGFNYSIQNDSLSYQSYREYGVPSGQVPFSIVYKSDTTKKLFSANFNLLPSKIYSFYITGSSAKTDTVFREEGKIPRYTDSAVAVRVINLSIGGPSVNVTLASAPTVNEFSGLKYKEESNFKKFTLTAAIASSGLTFNINDATTGSQLTTYTLPQYSYNYPPTPTTETARFKAVTLVISGSVNAPPFSPGAYSVFLVANY